jgi:hypothetical protein
MDDKFKSLEERNIWELVDLPKGCCWVFDLRTNGCKKAHIVAKGFSQCPRLDYDETFSPVVRYKTICILLATSVLANWDIQALDVKIVW